MKNVLKKPPKKVGVRLALLIQLFSKYFNVAIQLIITMVLARILTPQEYGLVAIIAVFTSFFMILADAGISPAIIQRDDLATDDHNALMFMSLLLGLVLMLIFILLSFPIAMFYNDEQLRPLCWFASLSILFNALNMVPNGLLLKEKRFVSIGVRLIVSTICGGVVAVLMALMHFGAYSLIALSIVSSLVVFVWNKIATGIKFNNVHFISPLRKIFRYSAFQFGFSTINFFSRNLDNLLIGKFISITQLGFYDKAYKLTTYPMTFLSSAIGAVLQPYLVKYQNDPHAIYERWCRVAKPLSLIAAPVTALFFSASYEITILFYGDQWAEAAVVLQILSVSIYFQMMNNPTGAIFQASNHTDWMFVHSLVATTMTLIGLGAGLFMRDIQSVAIGISIAYCCHTLSVLFFLIHKTLNAKMMKYCIRFIPEIIGAVVCCGMVFLLDSWFSSNLIISLLEKALVILVPTMMLYCLTGQMKYLKNIVKR